MFLLRGFFLTWTSSWQWRSSLPLLMSELWKSFLVITSSLCLISSRKLDRSTCWLEPMSHLCGQNPVRKLFVGWRSCSHHLQCLLTLISQIILRAFLEQEHANSKTYPILLCMLPYLVNTWATVWNYGTGNFVARSLKHFRAYLYKKTSVSSINGKRSAKEAAVVLRMSVFHLQHFLIRLAF